VPRNCFTHNKKDMKDSVPEAWVAPCFSQVYRVLKEKASLFACDTDGTCSGISDAKEITIEEAVGALKSRKDHLDKNYA
jgi:hypothetical protein